MGDTGGDRHRVPSTSSASTAPTLFGVSVGPGDPELMTLAAIRAIRSSDVVAYPLTGSGRRAADVARAYLEGKERLEVPMPMGATAEERDHAYERAAERVMEHLRAGSSVAWLVLGDVSLYSTFCHLTRRLVEGAHAIEVVPGVTSMCAAAARLQVPLAVGDERLLVTTAADALADPTVLSSPGTRVVLKVGRHLEGLKEGLRSLGPDVTASLAERVGLEGESVAVNLFEAEHASYLSLAIVREAPGEA
jgi:precorrin-2/cobalt-factor-2 C20-methyltransferase